MGGLRVAVDIGGTFTDCVVVDEAGRRTVTKSLTTPGRLADGVLDATRLAADALGRTMRELLEDTGQFVHGTTQATNALLTRTGAVTGLLTTQGHEDALLIGRVSSKRAGLSEGELSRPWRLAKPVPIVPRALIRGVAERIDRDGEVVVALDEAAAVLAIAELVAAGVQSIAVSLLWSFANDDHERRLAALLAAHAPGIFVALSSELAPVLGEYERTATTAVNAYVGPKVSEYLQMLDSRLREAGLAQPLLVMQASGGLTSIADAARRPIVTLDSGPTGGILGCRYLSEVYEEPNVICTDVGGTSFEVGLVLDGEVPLDERPAAARSPGSTTEGCCASDRRAQRPTLDRPATALAASRRRSPMPTSCSATSTPPASSEGGWPSIVTRRWRHWGDSEPVLGWSPRRSRSGSSPS
jgi:N-methylhydantoinase A